MLELFCITSILAIVLVILKELLIKFIDADRDLLGYAVFAILLGTFISGLVCYENHGLLY